MLYNLRNRAANEDGFTLVELLVVILIIGILAAVALPTFLGQRAKGQDASAKSNARNVVSMIESCYATEQDYTRCDATALAGDGDQVPAGTTVAPTATGYTISATSDSTTVFRIEKNGGAITRTCTRTSKGACPSTGNW